jgi:translation initiation factor eIF-2B subunit gamma
MLSGASLLPNALPKAQFRAVVTCGYGSDLYPLIEGAHALSDEDDHDSPQINTPAASLAGPGHHHGQTKALLPVAGRRMVDWVLDGVEQAGVFGK